MSSDEESEKDPGFYREASKKIYDWLRDEDRFLIRQEFETRDQDFDSLDAEEKFFALMNFLEVRYIRLPRRVHEIMEMWAEIRKTTGANDVQFEVPNSFEAYISVSELHDKLLPVEELPKLFEQLLVAIGIGDSYRQFLAKKGGNQRVF